MTTKKKYIKQRKGLYGNVNDPEITKKLVKRNKRKVMWITFFVIVFVLALTLGLYYALLPSNQTIWPQNFPEMNGKDAQAKVQSGNPTKANYDPNYKHVVVYVGAPDCSYCTFAIYGDNDGSGATDDLDKTAINGAYGRYLNESQTIPNIALNYNVVGETQFTINDLFFDQGEEDWHDKNVQPTTNNIMGDAQIYKITNASKEAEDALGSFGIYAIDVATGSYYMQSVSLTPFWDATTETWYLGEVVGDTTVAPTPFGTTPSWFYFKDGVLRFYVTGIALPPTDGSTATVNPPTKNFWVVTEDIIKNGLFPMPNKE